MGKKKSSQASMKAPIKHEKKQQTPSPMKILRPKVYITDSSKFKNLVQELTGNGSSPAASPCFNSPPPYSYHDSSLDMSSFDSSSCFSTPSPDLRPFDSFDSGFDFSSQIMDLESLLMGIDSISNAYDSSSSSWCGPTQQEVCVYDYDLSSFV